MENDRLRLIAACAFGLEALVKRELVGLGYQPHVAQPGRVAFEGDWKDVCRANIHLRVADRVLIEVHSFDAPDFDALFETIKGYDYSRFIPADAQFPVTGKTRLSQLTSLPAVQRSTKKAVVESMKHFHGTEELPETGETYKIEVALLKDVATITIDTTGSSLHKRGYRTLVGPAPIKETLAAAMVDLSVWKPNRPLLDPFCGTGTIPIEAALAGLKIAPGINRDFASTRWAQIDRKIWNDAVAEALDLQDNETRLEIEGFDVDAESLDMARYHAKLAGVEQQIVFAQRAFEDTVSAKEFGCLITNPPYGERLQQQDELRSLYQQFPAVVQQLPTWSLFVITSMLDFEKIVQKKATRRRKLFNGRLECTYFQYLGPRPPRPGQVEEIASPSTTETATETPIQAPTNAAPVFAGLQAKDHEQAEIFGRRLVKRARHLRRWPTRRGITCFRIYERDVPEVPLVVDRYDDSLHITEYERPHERDLARHSAWLELMKETAAKTLEVPVEKVHLKSRHKRSRGDQYQKVADAQQTQQVTENGLKFWVNLSDYVDTGLFLDHRVTRQMVREQSAGKTVLNLFAYTGSFTVYAAAGGAAATTTVDLSKNYLQWAQRNLELNSLYSPNHEYIARDCVEFVNEAVEGGERKYDIVIIDPPTYSNSKRLDDDWNVQTGHAELLNATLKLLNPDGVIYFSTNFRKFKLYQDQLSNFSIQEISKHTVPEDFRNRRIHRCWKLMATG
jgi:23S rRNA (guanine2445-N2)-methyltransferase / 23S rRNA (guanine2069-N7)-methyltransferase